MNYSYLLKFQCNNCTGLLLNRSLDKTDKQFTSSSINIPSLPLSNNIQEKWARRLYVYKSTVEPLKGF